MSHDGILPNDALHDALDELQLIELVLDPDQHLHRQLRGQLSEMLRRRRVVIEDGITKLETELRRVRKQGGPSPEDDV